jgi:hypothetical protein
VGCSLEILDKNGKKIFEVPDLYKGNDVLDSQESLFFSMHGSYRRTHTMGGGIPGDRDFP